jgi:nucleoside-diphosphate-sugar epimerase
VRQPDITLAREVLSWEPQVDLADGIKLTIERSGIERLMGAS